MKVCPKCLERYDDDEREFCTQDGSRLIRQEQFDKGVRDSMIGRSVAGRFPIVKRIEGGGMGTVYEAQQLPVGRPVALKVLKEELSANPVLVKRFEREAKAVSRLKSPYTVTLHDFGQDDDGLLFLAMELLEGETLSRRIENDGAMPYREALRIALQVTESLIEAHEKGIIHRDLKPDNVFLTEVAGKTHVKVLDFGIARLSQQEQGPEAAVTHTGAIFGTPGYMSPEQATGTEVDHRTDLYSLGVILYESLCGKPPFRADSAVMLMGQHISAKVPSLFSHNPVLELPEGLEDLVLHMLEKSPSDRVESAVDLSERITALLGVQDSFIMSAPGFDRMATPSREPEGEPPAEESDPEVGENEKDEESSEPEEAAKPQESGRPVGLIIGLVVIAIVIIGALAFVGSGANSGANDSGEMHRDEPLLTTTQLDASIDARTSDSDDASSAAAESVAFDGEAATADAESSDGAVPEDSSATPNERTTPRKIGRDRPGRNRNGSKRPGNTREDRDPPGGSPLQIDHTPLTRKRGAGAAGGTGE